MRKRLRGDRGRIEAHGGRVCKRRPRPKYTATIAAYTQIVSRMGSPSWHGVECWIAGISISLKVPPTSTPTRYLDRESVIINCIYVHFTAFLDSCFQSNPMPVEAHHKRIRWISIAFGRCADWHFLLRRRTPDRPAMAAWGRSSYRESRHLPLVGRTVQRCGSI